MQTENLSMNAQRNRMDEKLQNREHSMNVPRIPSPPSATAKAARIIGARGEYLYFCKQLLDSHQNFAGRIHHLVILFGYVMLCVNLGAVGAEWPIRRIARQTCEPVAWFLVVGCKQTYSWRKLCVRVCL